MAKSSGTTRSLALVGGHFDASGFSYEIADRQLKVKGSDFELTREHAYFVGSGAVARTFLLNRGSFLFESPATLYTGKGWQLSPGYDRFRTPHLWRAVVPGCLECHASGVQATPGTHNGFAEPAFREGGVSCERCHGPGSDHVQSGGKVALVNPAQLDAQRRDDICAQCHLTGAVRVSRVGKKGEPFLAGRALSDWVSVFTFEGSGRERLRVTSHVEKLAQSRCRQVSGAEKMWCGTCHDPHPTTAVASLNQGCLGCHTVQQCKTTVAAKTDCVTCHMPKKNTADAQHVVYTDHSIPRSVSGDTNPVRDRPLVVFDSRMSAAPRELGLAYARAAQQLASKSYREKALGLLGRREEEDSEALVYLAELRRDPELFERVLQTEPTQLTALVSLGAIRAEAGRAADAMGLWERALKINPGLPLVRYNLAGLLAQQGRTKEAVAHLQEVLTYQPVFPEARKLLKEILRKRDTVR